VINLPDLETRPLGERLTLVELFLQEEASRVGIPISVSPLALAALLSFRATGNVGELRSAVAYLSAGETVREAERLVGVEDRLYLPAAAGRPPESRRDDYIPPDLYRELHRRVTGCLGSGLQTRELQRLIQTDLDYYLQRLLRRADVAGRVPNGLLDVVADFVSQAGAELGRTFGQEVVTTLALHLASGARADLPDADQTLALVSHRPAEYGVLRRLAGALVVLPVVRGPAMAKARGLALALSEIGVRIWAITDDPDGLPGADLVTFLPAGVPECSSPLYAALPLYQLTYFTALAEGKRPDCMRLLDQRYLRARLALPR